MNVVDEYISAFPVDVQKKLEQIRAAIIKSAPSADETIGYGMPTYKLNGNLVHFAGWKTHNLAHRKIPGAAESREKG